MGAYEGVRDRDWQRLVEQIRNGDCTPFLGAGASSPPLPRGDELGRQWAAIYRYPFGDGSNLPEVMQYASIIEGDAVTIKQRVVDDLLQKGDPNYADHIEPHALLARYPIKVHLTTNYDDYMTRALELAGKHPVTAICPWYRGAERDADTDLPADYEPTSERPLVYHLHGTVRRPASLVITEQDYVEFLVNLAKDLGADDRRMVPTQVLSALTTQPLLFIGYSLRDWSFRMLFHGLVEAVAPPQRRRHVSVQLAPNPDIGDADVQRRAKDYLTSYFDTFRISVYWGSAREFCAELNDRLEAAR